MIHVYGNSHANAFTNTTPGHQGDSTNDPFRAHCARYTSGKTLEYATVKGFLTPVNKDIDWIILTIGEHDIRIDLVGAPPDNIRVYVDLYWDKIIEKLLEDKFRVVGYSCHPTVNVALYKEWVSHMKKKCSEKGIPYLDITSYVLNPDDTINKLYYLDAIHLNHDVVGSIFKSELQKLSVLPA